MFTTRNIIVLIAVGAAVSAVSCFQPSTPGSGDRDFEKVDRYLKQNLPNSKYEVVRWWSCGEQTQTAQQQIDALREKNQNLAVQAKELSDRADTAQKNGKPESDWIGDLQASQLLGLEIETNEREIEWKQSHLRGLCRLKFRTLNENGAMAIRDMKFVILDSGVAEPIEGPYGSWSEP